MYLLKNKQDAYWLYSDTAATNSSKETIHECLIAFFIEKEDNWNPSDGDATLCYRKYNNHILCYNKGFSEERIRSAWDSTIVLEFPDDWDYKTFAKHYPELLI